MDRTNWWKRAKEAARLAALLAGAALAAAQAAEILSNVHW
jgi:hypothetical protein